MKAQPRNIESPYFNTREAMDYLRLTSPSSLYYLINQQRLPHLRRGGRLLFDRRDLDAWLRGTDAVSLARVRRA
jgi:excisionase family DNA binding protein